MSSPVALTPEGESLPPLPFLRRLVGIFISPGPTFAALVRKPDFLAPLLATVAGSVVVTEAMLAKIGMDRIVRISLERSGRASAMGAEKIQEAIEQGAAIGASLTHVSGVLAPVIFLLIVAAVGMFIVNAIFGHEVKFKTCFAVTCHAILPTLLGYAMALAVILFGDPNQFNFENPIPSNVGFFLDPVETSKPLLAFAGSFDIFAVQYMVLLSIGFSEATGRKLAARSVFLTYFGLWMIWVLGKVGLAMLTS